MVVIHCYVENVLHIIEVTFVRPLHKCKTGRKLRMLNLFLREIPVAYLKQNFLHTCLYSMFSLSQEFAFMLRHYKEHFVE